MKKKSWSIVAGLLCMILATAITVQVRTMKKESSEVSLGFASDTLKDSLLSWKEKSENAEKELADSTKQLEDARNASTADNDETKAKKEQLEKNNMLMGLTDVEGDGIVVTIKDSISSNPSEDLNSYLVHDGDIREIVSELENAGAEAIEINGQRVVSSTCIVCAGNIISVNGEKVNSPFVIKAIGNQESLYSITRPGGYLQILQSATIPAEVKKESNITIGKYNGAIPQKYLKEDK